MKSGLEDFYSISIKYFKLLTHFSAWFYVTSILRNCETNSESVSEILFK